MNYTRLCGIAVGKGKTMILLVEWRKRVVSDWRRKRVKDTFYEFRENDFLIYFCATVSDNVIILF